VNRLYHLIEEDPVLKKDIKMFAMAIGNNAKQAGMYRKKLRVPFPILTDQKGEVWMAMEKPGTPTLLLCTPEGKVLAVHQGVIEDLDEFLAEIRELDKSL
jgi:hypothetical protein